jgi:flagellar motor switch/type III secretory pathway protein FliN
MNEGEPAADPFSSDLFGSDAKSNAAERIVDVGDPQKPAVKPELKRTPSWMDGLPKISRKMLESSGDEKLPDQLPDVLVKAIEDALSEVVFAESGRVRCRLEAIAQCDLFAEASGLAKGGDLAVRIVFEPVQSYASAIVGSGFVHRIIDKIFGPSGQETSNRISPIEMAIAEFLAVRVVAHINDRLGNEFFSFAEASLAPAEIFNEHEAGVKACIEVQTEDHSQVFQVLISRGFLSGLKKTSVFDSEADERRAAKLFRTMRSVPLRAQIGSTQLDAATLSFLEPGDIVIIEESQISWNDGSPQGELRLLAGSGNNFVLTGDLKTANAGLGGISVLLKDISSREAVNDSQAARFFMEDKQPDEVAWDEGSHANGAEESVEPQETNEISASLENLQLRLRVELAGKKISLREINSLRVGQVIDLERGPTDSVDLVTDGSDQAVAVGELVDIDGRLGVRLTKVFV